MSVLCASPLIGGVYQTTRLNDYTYVVTDRFSGSNTACLTVPGQEPVCGAAIASSTVPAGYRDVTDEVAQGR